MKKVLTLIAVATLSLGLGAISFAQDAGPAGGQIQTKKPRMGQGGIKLMEKIQKDVLASLNLTSDQQKKIDDLNKDLVDKVKAIQDANKGTEGNKNLGAQRRKVMDGYRNDLQGILTTDQWKQYREGMLAKMKEAREKRKERNGDSNKGGA